MHSLCPTNKANKYSNFNVSLGGEKKEAPGVNSPHPGLPEAPGVNPPYPGLNKRAGGQLPYPGLTGVPRQLLS